MNKEKLNRLPILSVHQLNSEPSNFQESLPQNHSEFPKEGEEEETEEETEDHRKAKHKKKINFSHEVFNGEFNLSVLKSELPTCKADTQSTPEFIVFTSHRERHLPTQRRFVLLEVFRL